MDVWTEQAYCRSIRLSQSFQFGTETWLWFNVVQYVSEFWLFELQGSPILIGVCNLGVCQGFCFESWKYLLWTFKDERLNSYILMLVHAEKVSNLSHGKLNQRFFPNRCAV